MPSEWRETIWGELATLEYGKSLRGYGDAVGAYRVFGTNGPIGWHTEPLCPFPSVVIGRKGAYRGVHFSPKPFFVIDTAFYLKPKVELDIRWAYYQLLTQDINGMDSGSAIPSTSREEFYKLPVAVPPVEMQRDIAETLTAFDDKIALLRETNATLEAIAQALFKSWFVDFDPVRAKSEGRDPEGVPPEVADLFPSEFEDSELGEIPKGWRVGVFGELSKLVKGSVNPMTSPDQVFEHYSLPAFDVSQLPVFELGQAIKSNKTRLVQDVVLQSKLNPHIPRVWLPYRVGDNAVSSTEFLPWMAQAPASQEFIFCLLTSTAFSADVCTLVTGTSNSHQRVRPEQVAALATVIPPASVMSAFEEMTNPLFRRAGENRQSSDTLAKLRDTLLPRLMSGKLRIPEIQEAVEEVTE